MCRKMDSEMEGNLSSVSLQEYWTDDGDGTDYEWVPIPYNYVPLLDAVNTIIACLAVLGNGMVITVMLLRRRVFSSFTNRLILHQSVIDCIAGVMLFLHHVVIRTQNISPSLEDNTIDQLLCRFLYTDIILWWMNVASTYNLVCISLERFMATCHPVKHRNALSWTKLKFAVGTAWGIGLAYSIHFSFVFEVRHGYCQHVEMGPVLIALDCALVIVIEYLVPVSILLYTYSHIFSVLAKKIAHPVSGPRRAISKAKKNVLVTSMIIGIMFAVCWAPIEVLYIYQKLSSDCNDWLYLGFTSLSTCNLFVNPIIYCFKYEHFRRELKKFLLMRCRRHRVGDGVVTSIPAVTSEAHTIEQVPSRPLCPE